jgi:hypothetical protein
MSSVVIIKKQSTLSPATLQPRWSPLPHGYPQLPRGSLGSLAAELLKFPIICPLWLVSNPPPPATNKENSLFVLVIDQSDL